MTRSKIRALETIKAFLFGSQNSYPMDPEGYKDRCPEIVHAYNDYMYELFSPKKN